MMRINIRIVTLVGIGIKRVGIREISIYRIGRMGIGIRRIGKTSINCFCKVFVRMFVLIFFSSILDIGNVHF